MDRRGKPGGRVSRRAGGHAFPTTEYQTVRNRQISNDMAVVSAMSDLLNISELRQRISEAKTRLDALGSYL